jgi:hypothetical protein
VRTRPWLALSVRWGHLGYVRPVGFADDDRHGKIIPISPSFASSIVATLTGCPRTLARLASQMRSRQRSLAFPRLTWESTPSRSSGSCGRRNTR